MAEKQLYGIGPGILLRDQRITDNSTGGLHPHTFDFYIPPGAAGWSNIKYWIVVLHGGGATKSLMARACNVLKAKEPNAKYVNWDLLWTLGIAVAFPNGERCSGVPGFFNPYGVSTISEKYPDGIRNWSNRVFWSQADDVQMLRDLALHLTALAPPLFGLVLAGHSSGGMMVQRMWFEAPEWYDIFFSVAGPAAPDYDPVVGTIGLPGTRKPFFEVVGGQDPNIGITRAELGVFAPIWYANPENYSRALVVYDPSKPLAQQTPSTYSGSWGQFIRRVQAERPEANPSPGSPTSVLDIKIGQRMAWRDYNTGGTGKSNQYSFSVNTAAGHAWLSNRRKPENAPGHAQCLGTNPLRLIAATLP